MSDYAKSEWFNEYIYYYDVDPLDDDILNILSLSEDQIVLYLDKTFGKIDRYQLRYLMDSISYNECYTFIADKLENYPEFELLGHLLERFIEVRHAEDKKRWISNYLSKYGSFIHYNNYDVLKDMLNSRY